MFKSLFTAETARVGAAVMVILVAGLIGHKAGQGMDLQQWIGAAVAMLGSIVVAALVHTAPETEKAEAKSRRRD